jgi:hypothetical protein
MYYHAIAILSGDRRKSIINKTEEEMLAQIVVPYVLNRTVVARWGNRTQSYQVIDLRIYKTIQAWNRRQKQTLENFIGTGRNVYARLERRAQKLLGKKDYRVFVIMPIQGEKYGSQDQQRIYQEYDKRFEVIVGVLGQFNCVAIRIDKEHPIEDLVNRIKDEIKKSQFIIADLTDERPSCYFEVGFAEALKRPVIYIASKESVISPKSQTKIHFDIHMSVNYFTNHEELVAKIKSAIEKNRDKLFAKEDDSSILKTAE